MLASTSSDLLVNFIGGAGAAVLGFAFAAIWEMYKHRRDGAERERTLVRACRSELAATQDALRANEGLLRLEVAILAEEKSIPQPLVALDGGALELLLLAQPSGLRAEDIKPLVALRTVIRRYGDTMRAREEWKFHGYAASKIFAPNLKTYDELLLARGVEFSAAAGSVEALFDRLERHLDHALRFERRFDEAGAI